MKNKIIIALALIAALLLQCTGANEYTVLAGTGKPTHGSSDSWIKESQLVTTVPAGYQVNPATQGKGKNGDYNAFFLKEEVQTISITIDENNLNYLFQNANEKPTVLAESVTIGDETVGYVGLKTKGSYTLEHSYSDNPGSDRFSLTINFGKYVKKADFGETQNFHGVDKISLNNFFFDKSMMKEYISLLLMSEMGLPTPQFGLAKLYINGEYYGVYSIIEALDKPILEQYYNCSSKDVSDYLCKPEGTNFIYEDLERDWAPMWERDQNTLEKVRDMIPTVDDWAKKLNQLSQGTDFSDNTIDVNSEEYLKLLEEVIDIDEFLRYFAAHSFLCQLDNMFVGQKNFGLYISREGRALLIPWDYDLSFGTYSPVTAEATANYHPDLMFMLNQGDNVSKSRLRRFYSDFPLFYVIFQNDSLMEKYHTYMQDCARILTLGGTTSFGTEIEPGLGNKRIESLTESLTQAATEKVCQRGGYMNGIRQPRDLKNGLISLSKIIAMRSVGVYASLKELPTYVSGKGCNLAQVGNGQDNWWTMDNGWITAVEASRGWFSIARYNGASPVLTVTEIAEDGKDYPEIAEAAKYSGKGYFKVYTLKDSAAAKMVEGYSLSIPMGKEMTGKKLSFYAYDAGKITELTCTQDENIYTCQMDKPGIIVIMENGHAFGSKSGAKTRYIVMAAGAGLLLIAAVILTVGRIRKKRK